MSVQIGFDLVEIDEVRDAVRDYGDPYLTRVYTNDELRYCGHDAARLATRFAAKEALIKALQPQDDPLPWKSIAVRQTPRGPQLELIGAAASLAERLGVQDLSLSLVSRQSTAAAVVVAALA